MAKMVIIGGSFGGLTAAFELKRLLGNKADVTLLCDVDKFVFVPSLPWLSMGWRTPEEITLPLEKMMTPKGIKFINEEATHVDADKSTVNTKTRAIPYDYLVIASGPALGFSSVPGFGPEGGHTECIFTLEQAMRANKAWNRFLEKPGPVVVGAVQGVSCFGPAYEYVFEVDTELRRRKLRHKTPITFVTSEPYIGHFGIGGLKTSRRIMEDEFASREIRLITNQSVEEFTPDEVRLKDGTKLAFNLAMFAPPMAGVKAVFHIGNPKGFIPVDSNYRHIKYKNIFSVGVAIAIAPPEQTPVPTGVPKTGYMTEHMAKYAAESIASEVLGKSLPQTEPVGALCIMDMGHTAALMKAYPVLPPRKTAELKEGKRFRWAKLAFEKYYLWKISRGLTNLP
ncbi:MAG: FAD-dependent oxidoreductase [Nitrospirae bacterium]|nr:FAD-dependent oxidoreductase [Nitrospirota bacterium]